MKLTLDIALGAHWLSHAENNDELKALAFLTSRAQRALHAMPLEAYVCQNIGLREAPDFPIAPMAAQADGLALENHIWLRADPVHFVLQRDAFSLHDEVPIALDIAEAQVFIAHLNQHFSGDGLHFSLGNSGHWYVHFAQNSVDFYPVRTSLPQLAAGKSVQHFLPQGQAAKKWRSVLNEVQMLLHDHPVNLALENAKKIVVNSLWLSGGGVLPSAFSRALDKPTMMVADNPFYAGLANLLAVDFLNVPNSTAFLSEQKNHHLRLALSGAQAFEKNAAWISSILDLLKKRKIRALILNVGFYDQTLTATISPLDLLKIWRQPKPLFAFFEQKTSA